MSLAQPLYWRQGQEQLTQGLESVSFPWNCKINSLIHRASALQGTFVDTLLPTRFGGKYSCQWVSAELSLESTAGRRHCRSQNTSRFHSFCRRPAGIFFYLSFLAGAFQNGNASYLLTSRSSVYLWISFPPLVCQYPSLLIFWAGCMAQLFAQALDWGRGGEHVWFILEGTLSWADTDQQAICFICKFLMVARGCLDTFNK